MGKDKFIHAGVCAVAVVGCGLAMSWLSFGVSLASGVALALGLGIGKEVGDYFNPNSRWDSLDLIADIVGTLIGAGILVCYWLLRR